MVTQITLGNFFTTSDGKQVLGGIGGSGLNTQSIVESLVKIRSLPATNDQNKITANGKISEALSDFSNLVRTFQSAADILRSPPGVNNAASNAFAYTTAALSASDGTAASNYLSVISEPGAVTQSYKVNSIAQLATAASQVTGTFEVTDEETDFVSVVAPPSGAQLRPGTITFAAGPSITLAEGDTLAEVAAKFNAVSSQTGVSATLIKIDDGEFKLSFTATSTGTSGDFDLTSVARDPGNTVFGNASLAAAVAGQNAQFYLNGILIERESNSVDDVIDNLTFNLLGTYNIPNAGGSSLTVNITPDTTLVQNSINNFVSAYNSIRQFVSEQTQVNDDGTYTETAVLANNLTFRQTVDNIEREILAQVSGLSGTYTSLAALDITLTDLPAVGDIPAVKNILTVNDAKLTSALATDFQNVKKLFGVTLSSNSSNLTLFSAPNSVTDTSFTLSLNPGTETFTADIGGGAPLITLEATEFDNNAGFSLVGPAGSALEGLTLIYSSTSTASISVTLTNGIAARTYNDADKATFPVTGTIQVELDSIDAQNKRLEDNIEKVNLQVQQYQQILLKQFAALEQAISRVNNLLAGLSANDSARQAANG